MFFLLQIKWENRFKGDIQNECLVSVDGTDFRIREPYPWQSEVNPAFYSSKFKGAGLRYEVAVSIQSGDIVWYHGPFPCGRMPDIRIYRLSLKNMLGPGEKVVADRGYDGDPTAVTPNSITSSSVQRGMSIARARQETVNRRFKQFKILQETYRHSREKHGDVFATIVCLTQLEIENGHPLFSVHEYVRPVRA